MIELELRYIAHITALTYTVKERYRTQAETLRQLIGELNHRYPGFETVFIHPDTGKLNLNAMIYYGEPGRPPAAVIDMDRPIGDQSVITFW